MPSTSAKQARTMAAAAHDPTFARKMGIPQTVAREYNRADAGTPIRNSQVKHSGVDRRRRDFAGRRPKGTGY